MRARRASSHLPIVAASSFNGEETRRMALEAGCVDYVRKPIDAIEFPRRVRSHLKDVR